MTSSKNLFEGVVFAVLAVVLVGFLVGCASLLIPYGLPHTADDMMATISVGFIVVIGGPVAALTAMYGAASGVEPNGWQLTIGRIAKLMPGCCRSPQAGMGPERETRIRFLQKEPQHV